MAENRVSEHEIRVYEVVRLFGGWMTAKEVSAAADVAERTGRAHCRAMGDLGLFEVAKVFGGYRYRIAGVPAPRAATFLVEVEAAKRAMSGQQ